MVTFDEVKRQANIKNHGFDFLGSEAVFEGFTITREDARDAYGELRLQTLGLWNGIVVFVVHTARGNADHVISIGNAEKHCLRRGDLSVAERSFVGLVRWRRQIPRPVACA